MSVVVTVAGIAATSVSASVFSGVCAAAAASLGMVVTQKAEQAAQEADRQALTSEATRSQIDVTVATEAALTELVAERCSMTFEGPNIRMVVQRDIRGKMTITAHGEGISRAEVSKQAEALLGKIRQQLAYRQVLQKMQQHGFQVSSEAQQADGTVRVHIRKRRKR